MSEEETAIEQEPETPAPAAPVEATSEPSPFESLLDEMDALKQRVAQLEQLVTSHGHAFDDNSISQIAQHVFKRINDAIRMRGQTAQR